MKYSALYPVVAGLALGAMLLPATALAEKKTPFTSTETDTAQDFVWLMNDSFTELYMLDGRATFAMGSDESRMAGSGWYSMDGTVDLATFATTLWGRFHIENGGGAWDGYWIGTDVPGGLGLTATLMGSRGYKGLVSQLTSISHQAATASWSGYIVENGPGDVPIKISGWREDQLVPLKVIEGNPVHIRASLNAGGGQASHVGVFTDVKKVGLVNFATGVYSATGTIRAANGDLLHWVAGGAMTGPPAVEASFVGGTGRFEHAFGFFAGPMQYQSPSLPSVTSYTTQATGKIRY